MKLASVPPRLTAGAYILHAGLTKWKGDEATAAATHGFAKGAYPMIGKLRPTQFLRLLAVGEISLGTLLLAPVVPDRLAGLALAGFSGSLLGLYARTPGMRKPGSIWPTQQGTGLSKDVWMFGIGLGLAVDG